MWIGDRVIGVGSRLLAGGCEARMPADAIDFPLVRKVRTCSGAHPASYSVGTRAQVPRIRMSGVLPLFPLSAFMMWKGASSFFVIQTTSFGVF